MYQPLSFDAKSLFCIRYEQNSVELCNVECEVPVSKNAWKSFKNLNLSLIETASWNGWEEAHRGYRTWKMADTVLSKS